MKAQDITTQGEIGLPNQQKRVVNSREEDQLAIFLEVVTGKSEVVCLKRYNQVFMTRLSVEITPNHPVIREYQRSLTAIRSQGVEHEVGLRRAFETLLSDSARLHNWTLISELGTRTSAGETIRLDATLRDNLTLPRGYWEAKDSRDDLDREIERKIRRGYPLSNIIFEDTRRAVLYQNRDHSSGKSHC